MRLIDADKLHPDVMTKRGALAISQGQLAYAPTINAVSEEVYTREYNLRKDAEFKVYKLEKAIDEIKAEIEQDAFKDVNGSKFISVNRVNQIIDKYRGE